jgi:PST family polysaccharide transporter
MTHAEIKQKALSGLAWNYVGNAVKTLCGLLLGVMLARILGPAPFGQIAVCLVVVSIGRLVCDMGLGPALIQSKEIGPHDIQFAFTTQCLLGLAMTGFVCIFAPLIAAIFSQPEVITVLRVLSTLFLINCAGQSAVQLLQRQMNFKITQEIQIAAQLVSTSVIGLPMALYGFGVWSLVAQHISGAMIQTVLMYAVVRHPIRPVLKPSSRGLLRFSTTVLFTNLVNATITNIDAALVSHSFGATGAGLYRRLQTLFGQPRDLIVQTLQRVLFTAGSRLQDDQRAIRRSLLMVTATVALLLFPAICVIAVIPDLFIGAILGSEWMEAVPLVVPLALAVCLSALMVVIGPLLWATNRVGTELRLQIGVSVLYFSTAPLAAKHSLEAFAWCITGIYLVRWLFLAGTAIRLGWIGAIEYLMALVKPLLVSVLVGAGVWGAVRTTSLIYPTAASLILFLLASILCMVCYLLIFIFHRLLTPPMMHSTVEGIKNRLPWGFAGL